MTFDDFNSGACLLRGGVLSFAMPRLLFLFTSYLNFYAREKEHWEKEKCSGKGYLQSG